MPVRIDDAVVRVTVDAESVRKRLEVIKDAEKESVLAAGKKTVEEAKKELKEEQKAKKKKESRLGKVARGALKGASIGGVGLALAGGVPLIGGGVKALAAVADFLDKYSPVLPILEKLAAEGDLPAGAQEAVKALVASSIAGLDASVGEIKIQNEAITASLSSTVQFLTASGIFGNFGSLESAGDFFNSDRQWNEYQARMRRNGQRAYLRNRGGIEGVRI